MKISYSRLAMAVPAFILSGVFPVFLLSISWGYPLIWLVLLSACLLVCGVLGALLVYIYTPVVVLWFVPYALFLIASIDYSIDIACYMHSALTGFSGWALLFDGDLLQELKKVSNNAKT